MKVPAFISRALLIAVFVWGCQSRESKESGQNVNYVLGLVREDSVDLASTAFEYRLYQDSIELEFLTPNKFNFWQLEGWLRQKDWSPSDGPQPATYIGFHPSVEVRNNIIRFSIPKIEGDPNNFRPSFIGFPRVDLDGVFLVPSAVDGFNIRFSEKKKDSKILTANPRAFDISYTAYDLSVIDSLPWFQGSFCNEFMIRELSSMEVNFPLQ